MKFYITPDKKIDCEKRINRIFSKFTQQPKVTFSEVERKRRKIYTTDGEILSDYFVNIITVEIDDIQQGEWTLVASVHYDENIIALVDNKLFKHIPEQFGLEYDKCDHCGNVHKSRKKAHILYKESTGEWMQVGSSCVTKMIGAGGKYLDKIATQLNECVKLFGGSEEDFFCGCWDIPSHYGQQAIPFYLAVSVCKRFYDEDDKNKTWVKPEYDRGRKIKDGTNDYLQGYFQQNHETTPEDKELSAEVRRYVETLKGGDGWDGLPNFQQRIKDAAEDEFIQLSEMYLPYFAMKGYLDSLSLPEWENKVKELAVGEKYDFVGTLIKSEYFAEEYYPSYYICEFLSDNGVTFTKTVTSMSTIHQFCIDEENKRYMFTGKIGYIDKRKRVVKFNGRLSKTKIKKNKKNGN